MTVTDQNADCKRLGELERVLYSIAITLGLEVYNDALQGDSERILTDVERALNGRDLKNFLRGVRAGRSIEGKCPDWIEGL
jgi:hypothetical protein